MNFNNKRLHIASLSGNRQIKFTFLLFCIYYTQISATSGALHFHNDSRKCDEWVSKSICTQRIKIKTSLMRCSLAKQKCLQKSFKLPEFNVRLSQSNRKTMLPIRTLKDWTTKCYIFNITNQFLDWRTWASTSVYHTTTCMLCNLSGVSSSATITHQSTAYHACLPNNQHICKLLCFHVWINLCHSTINVSAFIYSNIRHGNEKWQKMTERSNK